MNKDLREFIALLNSHGVEFVVVGGYCVAFHGVPRFTGDIDLFVRVSPVNAERLEAAIRDFGFGSTGLTREDFLQVRQIIQLGFPPNRIDLLTGIDGVGFDEAWASRVHTELAGLPVFMLSKELLIRNKEAANRPQDRADLERLKATD